MSSGGKVNGDIKHSTGLLGVQDLDMGERKMASASIQLPLPLAVDVHLGDGNEVAHLQSIMKET